MPGPGQTEKATSLRQLRVRRHDDRLCRVTRSAGDKEGLLSGPGMLGFLFFPHSQKET